MTVTIWGARGSHPHPMTPARFRHRVKSIVQRIRPGDISSNENRERFLAALPDWLWGMPGGNTPCIEIRLKDNTCLIFDAGTGIIPLSRKLFTEEAMPSSYHVFFSHFHYDHIQGLPFFSQAYIPSTHMHFYSPERDVEYTLKEHMRHPFFPVTMEEKMTPNQFFHHLMPDGDGKLEIRIGGASIKWLPVNHPGNAYAFRITEDGKSFIYATDYEIGQSDFEKTEENRNFFTDSDVLLLDTMYTLGEAIEKFNWGHSSFSMGVDFAHAWNTGRLLLFHHEPQYDDQRLYSNLRNARWYAERQNYQDMAIDIAEEGMEIEL
jgi:phosphoribosyl 1,2-cyclic phosphodiesterase